MSDIFRKGVLSKLPSMPPTRAPWADRAGGADDGSEELEVSDSMSELGASPPSSSSSSSSRRMQQDLSPLSAATFFAQALEINPPGSPCTFRAYITPPQLCSGPSSLTSPASMTGQSSVASASKGTCVVCHHGAGAGGLSFAALAKEIRERDPELGVLSFDARGHGKTRTEPEQLKHDLSLSTLVADLMGVIEHVFPDHKEAPALLLMGHSMGAAPILGAETELRRKGYEVPGVVVLDVVEGTAVESLPLMNGILSKRPTYFQSVIDGIHWHLQSSAIRSATSARVSVPSYLKPSSAGNSGPRVKQVWRTDLAATAPYWSEWWSGLSQKFLTARCARLLVLAGQERLDKDLMVGQMQGKFQLEVMQDVGHYLHEDDPAKLAAIVLGFWRRNTQLLVLPPKIGAIQGERRETVEVRRIGDS